MKILTFIIDGVKNEDLENSITFNYNVYPDCEIIYGNKNSIKDINSKYFTYIKPINGCQCMYNTVMLDDIINILKNHNYDIIFVSSLEEKKNNQRYFDKVNDGDCDNFDSAIYLTSSYNNNKKDSTYLAESIDWLYLKRCYSEQDDFDV